MAEKHCSVLGARIDPTSYDRAVGVILRWAQSRESRSVYAANVHMVMEAYDDPSFRRILNDADLVTPDGVPLVWIFRMLGVRHQQRVYGPDLTLHVCRAAAQHGLPVALFGGTPPTLEELTRNLVAKYQTLNIVSAISPPFREPTPEEDEAYTKEITESGAAVVLVGLGCPKQEKWIAGHRNRIPAVMMGVGAAFDFHAGRVKQAPAWMQRAGLEWFFRLLMEPTRLWRRYLKHNPRFVVLAILQVLGLKRFETERHM